ncbi:dethiobiotin synthase [Solimonas terrae]|uniref:ATP-dependent dethiobiotin synthetase BioD n=1 Tax=Solimonas terrae TaxID=1396819 RepID=A0A6M2BRV8_9GAMM|nr:dethiobiotin synthase [Solimonas terrae]NGY05070.1 dethiobiotin synthase [Solimonas terrae]
MTSAKTLFITGTDTGVGKTRASAALIRLARARGLDAVGFKPVAAGCTATADGWRNDDALELLAASDHVEAYEAINPCALPAAIAPHLAAQEVGATIARATLDAAHADLCRRHACVIVEGAGGWRVPLDADVDFADWVGARGWPVVLVVGLRLGCLNHALLTAESIARRVPLAGWIANRLPPAQDRWQDNVATLRARLSAPCLGVLPEHGDDAANRDALDTTETRRLFELTR